MSRARRTAGAGRSLRTVMDRKQRIEELFASLEDRIVILDGAMGTMIQAYKLSEEDYRGERFADWSQDLKGNNDLLSITKPQTIREIHTAFLEAGADILETNTFNSNAPSMADYGMESLVAELNLASARLAREVADAYAAKTGETKYVAGVLGPTNRTASISPDVNDPGFRNIRFEDLADTYEEAALALIEGGVDFLMIETIFDTLNAKAAIFAVQQAFEKCGEKLPVMISGTITDASGQNAVRPDDRSLLELGPPCRAVHDWPELCARRERPASLRRRAITRCRYACQRTPERGPAERVRRVRRDAGRHGGNRRRVCGKWASST